MNRTVYIRMCWVSWGVACAFAMPAIAETPRISLATRSIDGGAANDRSGLPAIAPNGRVVVFSSEAANLVAGDSNGAFDIFLGPWPFEACEVLSIDWKGEFIENGAASLADLTVDGRFVVFHHVGNDLVQDDNNGLRDVFLRDRLLQQTTLISRDENGEQGDYASYNASITPDALHVTFGSTATNWIDKDNVGVLDVFARNLLTGELELISVASDGTQGNNDSGREGQAPLTPDGRFVVFNSRATNLVKDRVVDAPNVYLRDREKGTTAIVNLDIFNKPKGAAYVGAVSSDGRYVTFTSAWGYTPNDNNERDDVYMRDMVAKKLYIISLGKYGVQNGELGARGGSISANGRFIAFDCDAINLDDRSRDGLRQIYIRDFWDKDNGPFLVSYNDDGEAANARCEGPKLSSNGRFVTFVSAATNLVDTDTFGVEQVYVIDALGCNPFPRADSNGDGEVASEDIDAFVLALIDETQYQLAYPSADWECNNDINRDGRVDFDDIDPFVECMINGGCP